MLLSNSIKLFTTRAAEGISHRLGFMKSWEKEPMSEGNRKEIDDIEADISNTF